VSSTDRSLAVTTGTIIPRQIDVEKDARRIKYAEIESNHIKWAIL
jgi:hypothetical protein